MVFEKLHKFIGKNIKALVSQGDQPCCLRLQKNRVFYVREDMMRRATNVRRRRCRCSCSNCLSSGDEETPSKLDASCAARALRISGAWPATGRAQLLLSVPWLADRFAAAMLSARCCCVSGTARAPSWARLAPASTTVSALKAGPLNFKPRHAVLPFLQVARDKLVALGACIGKFTHSGKFRLTIGALDLLAQYAKYKVGWEIVWWVPKGHALGGGGWGFGARLCWVCAQPAGAARHVQGGLGAVQAGQCAGPTEHRACTARGEQACVWWGSWVAVAVPGDAEGGRV